MKTRTRALCLCLAAVILCALPVGALGAVKPKLVTLNTKSITIDLAKGSTFQLTGKVSPTKASQKILWRSGNTSIAKISSTGLITARKKGTVTVGGRPATLKKWSKAKVRIIDSLCPTSISLNASSLKLSVKSTFQLSATAKPASASQEVKWSSNNQKVAKVSSAGLVTAIAPGTALIRAASVRSSSKNKTIKVTVSKLPAPTKLILSPADTKIEKGDTLQLTAQPSPSDSDSSVKWTSSKTSVASVSSGGLVTAKAKGTAKITATSAVNGKVSTVRTLTVVDTKAVTSVEIESDTTVIFVGGTLTLNAEVLPATAPRTVSWTSNNASVASISASGVVSGKASGSATITVKAGAKTDTLRIVVQKPTPVTEEPAQVTSVSGVNANLAKLDDILRYATTQLDALYVSGAIKKDEMNQRKTILLNAFKMARFPWMSSNAIPYWSGSGSYKSNVVYFGSPYTQKNRTYNVEKLLSSGAFAKTGSNAYYTAKLPAKTYPGNDCSSFVSMSVWGMGTSYSQLNSTAMKTSPGYRTIASSANQTGYLNMRPGDVLVKSGHTLMFLYYASSSKSQIMIIQQGGYSTLSTVGCDLKALSYYSGKRAYIARRKKSFS